jgi:hypothetical protein
VRRRRQNDSTTEVIRAARTLLREKGWRQGIAALGDSRLCLGDALLQAPVVTGSAVMMAAWDRVENLIRNDYESDSLVRWNDEPGRTYKEADDLLAIAEGGP